MEQFNKLEEMFDKYWYSYDGFVVIPYTIRAKLMIPSLKEEALNIECILDNNSKVAGQEYMGIPVYFTSDYFYEKGREGKFIISGHYSEIKRQLEEVGYVEYIDFIDIRKYTGLYFWKKYRKLYLCDAHTNITTYCSLNCKNCSQFMNHYDRDKREHRPIQKVMGEIDRFFINVDYCYRYVILGGEAFLHPNFLEIMKYIQNNFGDRIGRIEVITNGTVIPPDEWFEEVSKWEGYFVSISDYSKLIEYSDRIDMLEKKLIDYGINYQRNKDLVWKDLYFPSQEPQVEIKSVREHMIGCDLACRGVNDGKFYYCHIAWGAENAGLYKAKPDDYILFCNVTSDSFKREMLMYDLGFLPGGYMSFCRLCGGFGVDNPGYIEAAVQENNAVKDS